MLVRPKQEMATVLGLHSASVIEKNSSIEIETEGVIFTSIARMPGVEQLMDGFWLFLCFSSEILSL